MVDDLIFLTIQIENNEKRYQIDNKSKGISQIWKLHFPGSWYRLLVLDLSSDRSILRTNRANRLLSSKKV